MFEDKRTKDLKKLGIKPEMPRGTACFILTMHLLEWVQGTGMSIEEFRKDPDAQDFIKAFTMAVNALIREGDTNGGEENARKENN